MIGPPNLRHIDSHSRTSGVSVALNVGFAFSVRHSEVFQVPVKIFVPLRVVMFRSIPPAAKLPLARSSPRSLPALRFVQRRFVAWVVQVQVRSLESIPFTVKVCSSPILRWRKNFKPSAVFRSSPVSAMRVCDVVPRSARFARWFATDVVTTLASDACSNGAPPPSLPATPLQSQVAGPPSALFPATPQPSDHGLEIPCLDFQFILVGDGAAEGRSAGLRLARFVLRKVSQVNLCSGDNRSRRIAHCSNNFSRRRILCIHPRAASPKQRTKAHDGCRHTHPTLEQFQVTPRLVFIY
jgi:hypothetical protein